MGPLDQEVAEAGLVRTTHPIVDHLVVAKLRVNASTLCGKVPLS